MRIMKASIVTALLSFSVACWTLTVSHLSAVGGKEPFAIENGDVNGDLELDVSDAVYLLVHLFRSGPPPVAIANSPELVDRVEALEDALAEHSGRLSGLEARELAPCPEILEGRFRPEGDEIYTDTCTGLEWNLRDAVVATRAEAEAITGDGWRFPTVAELTRVGAGGARFGIATEGGSVGRHLHPELISLVTSAIGTEPGTTDTIWVAGTIPDPVRGDRPRDFRAGIDLFFAASGFDNERYLTLLVRRPQE